VDDLRTWAGPIAALIATANAIYTFLTAGSRQNAEEIREAVSTLAAHDRRIQAVESELRHLPDKDSVVELKLALAELKGTVGTLSESVGSVQRTVHRIDDYLRAEKA